MPPSPRMATATLEYVRTKTGNKAVWRQRSVAIFGRLAERFKAPVLKTGRGESLS